VGHRKDHLPIGRNFYAKTEDREGQQWVKCYFYWLKKADGAETLRENIDGGVYKECSIGFTFLFPECSVCGKDIRTCRHEPFKEYDTSGKKSTCYFNYRQIGKVLETSLVYRGAVADTSISKDLNADDLNKINGDGNKFFSERIIKSPLELDPSYRYVVTPFYEGLPVNLIFKNEQLLIKSKDGIKLPDEITAQLDIRGLPEIDNTAGLLIGFRGKERCSLLNLQKYIEGKASPVTRLELRLMPNKKINLANDNQNERFSISILRHCYTDVVGIDTAARSIMTREGVRLWLENETIPKLVFKYSPEKVAGSFANANKYYSLHISDRTGNAFFSIGGDDGIDRFIIRQLNLARLLKGGRFIADRLSEVDAVDVTNSHIIQCGKVEEYNAINDGIIMQLSGHLRDEYLLQPIKIENQKRWLLYKGNNKRQSYV
ncbi:MAG: hypothetical protein ABIJ12_06085, partial [bacterium]